MSTERIVAEEGAKLDFSRDMSYGDYLHLDAVLHHVLEGGHGVPDVRVAEVERGKAEAQDVGRAEVADHAAGDQGLHDRIAAICAREADLAAALVRIARRGQRQAVAGAARFDGAAEG